MRFETGTVKPSSNNQQESLIKRDRVTNSKRDMRRPDRGPQRRPT